MFNIFKLLFEFHCFGLRNFKVFFTCIVCNGNIVGNCFRVVVFFHYRTTHTATHTSRHFNKTFMNLSAFNILECCYTVFNTIECDICIVWCILSHCFKYTTCCREETCTTEIIFIFFNFKLYVFTFEPVRKFFKCKNCINNTFVMLSFVFFGNARSDENCFCIGIAFLYIHTVSLHG